MYDDANTVHVEEAMRRSLSFVRVPPLEYNWSESAYIPKG